MIENGMVTVGWEMLMFGGALCGGIGAAAGILVLFLAAEVRQWRGR